MRLPDNLLAPLEIALNRYLAEDEDALKRLAGFPDEAMALRLREFDSIIYLCPHAGGFQVMGDWPEIPRATVTASLPVLARMMMSSDKGRSLVLDQEITVEGDSDFAQALMDILRDADFDPEEWLSRYIGDVAAYRVGQLMRGLFQQGQKTAESLSRDTVNFLRDDTHDLVARSDITDWMDDVDALRADVERLEARIKRLRSSAESGKEQAE